MPKDDIVSAAISTLDGKVTTLGENMSKQMTALGKDMGEIKVVAAKMGEHVHDPMTCPAVKNHRDGHANFIRYAAWFAGIGITVGGIAWKVMAMMGG